jgi:hypothetical protein
MKIKNLHDEMKVPSDLEARLEMLIDNLAEMEKRSKRRTKIRLYTGIAASIVILIFTGLLLNPKDKPLTSDSSIPEFVSTQQIDDPETAYREVRKALELMSMNLNKGIDEFSIVLTNEFKNSNEIINNSLKY